MHPSCWHNSAAKTAIHTIPSAPQLLLIPTWSTLQVVAAKSCY